MDLSSRIYQQTFERIVDDLAHRYSDSVSREEVAEVVSRGRTDMEATSHHPEFIPALVEHWARDTLLSRARRQGRLARAVPEVLFVCEHNEGRSQMAAALAEQLAGDHLHVRSAGRAPTGRLNPAVVEVLAERGVSLERAYASGVHDDVLDAADVVVLMGVPSCDEVGRRVESWDVADPQGQPVEVVRDICAQIEGRVRRLLADLDVEVVEPVTPTRVDDRVTAQVRRVWSEDRALSAG